MGYQGRQEQLVLGDCQPRALVDGAHTVKCTATIVGLPSMVAQWSLEVRKEAIQCC